MHVRAEVVSKASSYSQSTNPCIISEVSHGEHFMIRLELTTLAMTT